MVSSAQVSRTFSLAEALVALEAEAQAELRMEASRLRAENEQLREALGVREKAPKKRIYTREMLTRMIDDDMRAGRTELRLERCIMRLWYMQSPEEQMTGQTIDDNGEGVSKADADNLRKMASWILGRHDHKLTGSWVLVAAQMVSKYHRQLCAYANEGGHGLNVRFK